MAPFGKVIPVTGLDLGFPGSQTRTNAGEAAISARLANLDNVDNIPFGTTVYVIPDSTGGTVRSVAEWIADLIVAGAGVLDESVLSGIAVKEVKTTLGYPIDPTTEESAYYIAGQMVDSMQRGSILIAFDGVGTPVATGPAYLRVALNASVPAGVVGGIEAQADVPASTTGSASSGSTALTVASGTGIVPGQVVSGAGIAPGTFVAAVSGTSVTLSQNTTAALSTTPVTFAATIELTKVQFTTGVVDGNSSAEITILERLAA
jgi:hypothetical protein